MWSEIMEFASSRPVHDIYDAFKPAALVAAGVSVVAAISADSTIAWSAAIVAGGAVVVPRCLDWYRSYRMLQREQYAADIALDKEMLAEEIRKRVEIEGECRQLKAEIALNRHRVNDLEQQIVFMRAATEKIGSQVKRITTSDTDAPKPVTD